MFIQEYYQSICFLENTVVYTYGEQNPYQLQKKRTQPTSIRIWIYLNTRHKQSKLSDDPYEIWKHHQPQLFKKKNHYFIFHFFIHADKQMQGHSRVFLHIKDKHGLLICRKLAAGRYQGPESEHGIHFLSFVFVGLWSPSCQLREICYAWMKVFHLSILTCRRRVPFMMFYFI